EVDTDRIQLDPARCQAHARLLQQALPAVQHKVLEVFSRSFDDGGAAGGTDPDQMLYSGGFFSPGDRRLMREVLALPPQELAGRAWRFRDQRLPLMLFRFRARNYPETLSAQERELWDRDRSQRLLTPADPGQFSYASYLATIAGLRHSQAEDKRAQRILDQLEVWGVETGLERLWQARDTHHG
ncbi:MAG TPA: exodeoxyribonuclease I, partial [Xanthomonadales bacterium]|nr:exodeoxyribonuclease I [Xanthomonadales bacterium]